MSGSSAAAIDRDAAVMYDRLRGDRQDMRLYVTCRCKVIKAALGCGWTPEMEARIRALDAAAVVRQMGDLSVRQMGDLSVRQTGDPSVKDDADL